MRAVARRQRILYVRPRNKQPLQAKNARGWLDHGPERYRSRKWWDMTAPENAGPMQAKGRFKPGQSGNPGGKAKGTRNRATLALEELLDGQAEALTRKAIDLALTGDLAALRLCMDRILPARKDRPVSFELGPITNIEEARTASAAILTAVAAGKLTPSEAADISKLIEGYVKSTELFEVIARIEKLESTRT